MQTLGDVITWGLIIAALIVVPCKIAKAWLWPLVRPFFQLLFNGPVKQYENSDIEIMSRSTTSDLLSTRPPLGRSQPRTDGPAQATAIPRDIMLDNLRMLRAHGFTRDEARQLINSLGASFKNDLWTEAAPPDDEYMTPIAGRSTNAVFDADYPYEPVP